MKKYKVNYMVTTKSRCGSYIYKDSETVDANSEEEAKNFVKTNAGSWYGFKRCSVKIISIIVEGKDGIT